MVKLVCKKDFSVNGKDYIKGDQIELNDIRAVRKLNEQGFIEPLTYRDLVLIERELENKKKEI